MGAGRQCCAGRWSARASQAGLGELLPLGKFGRQLCVLCFKNQMEQLKSNAKKAVWPLSLSLVQFLKVPEVRGSPVSRVLQERWPKLCLSSTGPQMSFVSANALKSVEFRRQKYGPLTNIINSVSAGPRAWNTLAAIWSL